MNINVAPSFNTIFDKFKLIIFQTSRNVSPQWKAFGSFKYTDG